MRDETIDRKTFRVNLGILVTLIGTVAAAAFYVSDFRSTILSMAASVSEVKTDVRRLVDQNAVIGNRLTLLDVKIEDHERRVTHLEAFHSGK